MSEYKTLEEIYKEVGKFPFTVEIATSNHSPVIIHGKKSNGNVFIAEMHNGSVAVWSTTTKAKLFAPPKPKKKVWEWLVTDESGPFISDLIVTEEEAKDNWPNAKLIKLREFEVDT